MNGINGFFILFLRRISYITSLFIKPHPSHNAQRTKATTACLETYTASQYTYTKTTRWAEALEENTLEENAIEENAIQENAIQKRFDKTTHGRHSYSY